VVVVVVVIVIVVVVEVVLVVVVKSSPTPPATQLATGTAIYKLQLRIFFLKKETNNIHSRTKNRLFGEKSTFRKKQSMLHLLSN
jgi:hypothetical protein